MCCRRNASGCCYLPCFQRYKVKKKKDDIYAHPVDSTSLFWIPVDRTGVAAAAVAAVAADDAAAEWRAACLVGCAFDVAEWNRVSMDRRRDCHPTSCEIRVPFEMTKSTTMTTRSIVARHRPDRDLCDVP